MTVAETMATGDAKTPQTALHGGKHLIFKLGNAQFGVAVLTVKEIIGIQDVTAVPKAPPHIKGVLNLRGQVIPVADLRTKFGLPNVEHTARTSILVVDLRLRGKVRMGVIVDNVSEVVNIAAGDVEPAPTLGGGTKLPFLAGIAKIRDRICLLLDLEQALAGGEQYRLGAVLS